MSDVPPTIVTVTLNPAIDQTLSIPGFAAGRVNRVAASETHPAGKGVNVARMLADLGEPGVVATGLLGAGNAAVFERMFEVKGIADRFVRIPGDTRVGIKIVDDGNAGQTTDVNFPGLTPTPAALDELLGRVAELGSPGRWFVLSGSVPAGVGPDVYARMIAAIRGKGGRVVLDTSGAPLREALRAGAVEIVKPNVAELAELAGRPLDGPAAAAEAARAELLSRGVRLAAVSMGGDGAVFVTADRALLARPPAVAVKSTVGAGDAMVAGLTFGHARGMPLDECARLATALGAYAVTRVEPGLAGQQAHEALIARVTIVPLD